jgi:hypothetical protein
LEPETQEEGEKDAEDKEAEVAPEVGTTEVAEPSAPVPVPPSARAASSSAASAAWRKWAFAAVPALAILELGMHLSQVSSVVKDDDWARAKVEVEKRVKPEDLVAFAPRWVDPVGREHFGPELATFGREAYPDVTRFPRAFEVSIRGEHLADLRGWRPVDVQKVGAITITTLENPTPVALKDDLLRHAGKPDMHVSVVDGTGEHECRWARAGSQTGNIGFGPGVPATRYVCGGNEFVGVTVMADLDYRPRHCFYAPPQGGGSVLRIRFDSIAFGKVLHGHHALSVEAERDRKGAPVTISFRSGDKDLGKLVHRDGEGWKGFELDTSELEGKSAELVAEISSSSGDRRQYCFEADTR